LARCPKIGEITVAFASSSAPLDPWILSIDPPNEIRDIVVPWTWVPSGTIRFSLGNNLVNDAELPSCLLYYADRPTQGVKYKMQPMLENEFTIGPLRSGTVDLCLIRDGSAPLRRIGLQIGPNESLHLGLLAFEDPAWLRVQHQSEQGIPVARASILTYLGEIGTTGQFTKAAWTVQPGSGPEQLFGPLASGRYRLETTLSAKEKDSRELTIYAGRSETIQILQKAK